MLQVAAFFAALEDERECKCLIRMVITIAVTKIEFCYPRDASRPIDHHHRALALYLILLTLYTYYITVDFRHDVYVYVSVNFGKKRKFFIC